MEVEEVRHDPHRTDDPADDAITDERNAAVHAEALLEGDRSGPRGGAGVHELEARAERDSGGLQDAVAAEGKADLGGSGGERAGNGGGDHRRGPCRTLDEGTPVDPCLIDLSHLITSHTRKKGLSILPGAVLRNIVVAFQSTTRLI